MGRRRVPAAIRVCPDAAGGRPWPARLSRALRPRNPRAGGGAAAGVRAACRRPADGAPPGHHGSGGRGPCSPGCRQQRGVAARGGTRLGRAVRLPRTARGRPQAARTRARAEREDQPPPRRRAGSVCPRRGTPRTARCHDIGTAPTHASAYRNRAWVRDANVKYAQYTCRWTGCKKMTRNFCVCSPGTWLCPSHIVQHAVDATRLELRGE